MMIDLDKIEASVSQLMRMYPDNTRATQSISEVEELISRLRQAEKDAARYRWLRDECRHEYGVDDLFDGSSDSIDERIDAAMIEE
ncbi:MAG: hypothetical protein ACRCXB_20745 [Aeromonadaceae bacterium]